MSHLLGLHRGRLALETAPATCQVLIEYTCTAEDEWLATSTQLHCVLQAQGPAGLCRRERKNMKDDLDFQLEFNKKIGLKVL